MENNIYNTISDPMYFKQLINSYENEEIEQWLLYLGKWWREYYDAKHKTYSSSEVFDNNDYSLFAQNCLQKGKKVAFISLGCGNSATEKHILNDYPDGYDVTYIWVDASDEMISMSVENLEWVKNEKIFLRADFGSEEFKNEINSLCKDFDHRVFAFFGGTFGNMKYTKIINILYNILNKDDKIWIDIWIRKWNKIEDDIKLFEIYKSYLTNPWKCDFLLSKIRQDGIDERDGEIVLRSEEQKESGAIKFSFYFKFNKKVNINIKNYDIWFLPWYSLKLLQIYRFWVEGFVDLLAGHNFELLEKQTKWYDWQFLFKKL